MATARQQHRESIPIEQVPEFRAYLREQGLPSLAAWRKRESSADGQTLELRRQRLALYKRKGASKNKSR